MKTALIPPSSAGGLVASIGLLIPSWNHAEDWLKRSSTLTTDCTTITHTGESYIAAGAAGKIVTSPDGITWKAGVSGLAVPISDVAKAGNEIVATANSGKITVSQDNGKTWKAKQLEVAPGHVLATNLLAVGRLNDRWIATGEAGMMMTSTDTTNWSWTRSNATTALRGVAVAKGLAVTVGAQSTFRYSWDGLSWSAPDLTSQLGLHDFRSVEHYQDKWVAVAEDGFVATAKDGETDWVGKIVPEAVGAKSVVGGGEKFMLVTDTGKVLTSPDADTWTVETTTAGGNCIAFGGDGFVAVGARGAVYQSPPVFPNHGGSASDNPGALWDDGQTQAPLISLPKFLVNMASLDVVLQGTLFRMNTNGVPIVGVFTFNRQPGEDDPGMFGVGWNFTYQSSITVEGKRAVLRRGTGAKVIFMGADAPATDVAPVVLTSPEGNFDTLTHYATRWELKEKDTKLVYRFDQANAAYPARLTRITDRNNNKIVVTVDQQTGVITDLRDSDSTSGSARIITISRVSSKVNFALPDSRQVELTIGGAFDHPQVTGIKDMEGNQAFYQYDEADYLTAINQQPMPWISFRYKPRVGAPGKMLWALEEGLRQTTYDFVKGTYGTVQRRDSRGNVTTITSRDGRVTKTVDPFGNVRSAIYNGRLPVSFTEPSGAKSSWTYDDRGNPLTATDPLGKVTTFTYDGSSNLLTRTDALGRVWSFQYDANHNLKQSTSPMGNITQLTYDSLGRVQRLLDPRLKETTFGYDNYGNLTQVTDPLNNITLYHYSSDGLTFLGSTDARGKHKGVTLDKNERVKAVTFDSVAPARTQQFTFDPLWLLSRTDELTRTTAYERNLHGLIVKRTSPLGNTRLTEFDGDDNPITRTDEVGRVTRVEYDKDGRPLKTTAQDGGIAARAYDKNSNLISLTDPMLGVTTFSYDLADRLLQTTYPDRSWILYERDALGRIKTKRLADGRWINYTYDGDGRLSTVQPKDAPIADSLGYDQAGNLIAAVEANGARIDFTYDDANQLKRVTESVTGGQVSYVRDAVGNATQMTYPDGTVVNYTFDALNRLPLPPAVAGAAGVVLQERSNRVLTMTWNSGRSETFTYDAASRMTGETRGNGITSTYAYDADDRMTGTLHMKGATQLSNAVIQYDASGNVVSFDLTHPVDAPLPLNTSFVYDKASKLTKRNALVPKYDLKGNLTNSGDAHIVNATYDDENRLTSVTLDGVAVSYTYGALGYRASKTVAGVTTRYGYDPRGRLLFETTAGKTTNYLYAGGRIVATGNLTDGYRYLLCDRQGSTVAVANDAGLIIENAAYSPHGVMATSSGSPMTGATFVGAYGVLHEGGGLYCMTNRFYDASLGRFLQRDPAGFQGGLNLYAYAEGNPMNRVDPTGLFSIGDVGSALWGLAKFGAKVAVAGGAGLAAGSFASPAAAPYVAMTTFALTGAALEGLDRSFGNLRNTGNALQEMNVVGAQGKQLQTNTEEMTAEEVLQKGASLMQQRNSIVASGVGVIQQKIEDLQDNSADY